MVCMLLEQQTCVVNEDREYQLPTPLFSSIGSCNNGALRGLLIMYLGIRIQLSAHNRYQNGNIQNLNGNSQEPEPGDDPESEWEPG